MKILKITLIIIGVALTSTSFGQRQTQDGESALFYTLAYNPSNNRLEHNLNEFPERHAYGDFFDVPLTSRTYFRPIETEISMESWMTNSFDNTYFEVEPFVESWMTIPFENSYYEEELTIESWMSSPFETSFYEEDLSIEPWMTKPFDLDEEIEVEQWMTTSWV